MIAMSILFVVCCLRRVVHFFARIGKKGRAFFFFFFLIVCVCVLCVSLRCARCLCVFFVGDACERDRKLLAHPVFCLVCVVTVRGLCVACLRVCLSTAFVVVCACLGRVSLPPRLRFACCAVSVFLVCFAVRECAFHEEGRKLLWYGRKN